jgi:hypothetical protein
VSDTFVRGLVGNFPTDRSSYLWYHRLMGDHRLRLSDDDVELIVRALRARAAMTRGLRRHRVERLAERLAEGGSGNPKWRLDEETQTHEEDLDEEDGGD